MTVARKPLKRESLIQQILLNDKIASLKAKESLYHFCKYMWNVIEPDTPFSDGWHIRVICDHLEAATEFTIPKLIINIPPRHMKSIIACVMWPAWVWGKYPARSFLFASHSEALATRDSLKTRQLIESEKYQKIFKPDWSLRDDQNTKTTFANTKNGVRKSIGVGTGVVGFGADYLVADDPNDPKLIHSEVHREDVKYWYDKVYSSRVNNPIKNCKVIIMQRLHEDDLSGHLLLQDINKEIKHDLLVLPAMFTSIETNVKKQMDVPRSKTRLWFKDPRTFDNQLLWGKQWSLESIKDLEASLGDEAEGQLQQDPKPKMGGLFPRGDWKYYDKSPSDILQIIIFVDCAQKPGISNDYSVWAVWAKTTNGFYLLDLWREKTTSPLLYSLSLEIVNLWHPNAMVIEDKSAGSGLIQHLRGETTITVLAFDPLQNDKVVRATAAAPTVKAGKCFLPRHIKGKDDKGNVINLVDVYIKEHQAFPKSKHDDTVDTTSMMTEYFNKQKVTSRPRVRTV